MSVLECLKWQNFSQAAEEHISTEGKSGVPRFDGDPSKLAEYGFRLRLKMAREKSMEAEQLKKLGPLGLRLIEGLRGPALQVARNLQIERLSAEDGASYLLKGLQTSLQPRSKQEARDLYQAGAQVGGVLSRQSTEAMSNYVLRRRAWHSAMVDLDPELTLPEGIRTEQLLLNAGITQDQQLMVRTAINGDMTWNKVCDELIAQHSRLHEKEKGKGGYRDWSYKGGKSYGKKKGHHFRSYYVEDDPGQDEQWENASQSLGGFEEFDGYYANDYEEEYPGEDDVTYEVYASMLDQGLDEEDQDAMAYAAEVTQAESEAYFMRQRAKGSGHSGFQAPRNFQVQGQLSFEEKRAKLQAVKNKTQCRKCGQYGHWQDDPACPKGSRKGKSKGGPGSSTTATSLGGGSKGGRSSGKSGGKSGKNDKVRTVYFTINEYEDGPDGTDMVANMVLGGDYRAVPPPSSLSQEVDRNPDQQLDHLIRQAELRNQERERERAQSSLHQNYKEHADLSDTEMSDDLGFVQIQDVQKEEEFQKSRNAYLDLYLSLEKDIHCFDYKDAYHERWNEFVRGHPDFLESDRQNLQRWRIKALQGLPKLPAQIQDGDSATTTTTSQVNTLTPHSVPQPYLSTTTSQPSTSNQPLPLEDGVRRREDLACQRKNLTRQGSNAYYKVLKCKDCGLVLEKEKLTKPEKMKTEEAGDCKHEDKDFRGTTATTWKWTCKRCGHSEKGVKRPGQTGLEASSKASLQGSGAGEGRSPCQSDRWCVKPDSATRSLETGGDDDAKKVTLLMLSTLELQEELGVQVQLDQLDRIYHKCKDFVEKGRQTQQFKTSMTTRSSMPSTTPTPNLSAEELQQLGAKVLKSGAHKGKSFKEVYEREASYSKSMVAKMLSGALKDEVTREFAKYAQAMTEGTSEAYMSILQPIEEEDDGTEPIVAVLDTGCNNSCHGDRWMKKFQEMIGVEVKTETADGRFRGVGGRVEVTCKRTIPINMMTSDKQVTPGMITSIELQDSDAPLLISSKAQKKLGLILDMSNMTAYSKVLDKELELEDHNGLPAIRLWPGSFDADNIAMIGVEECNGEQGQETESEEMPGENRHLPLSSGSLKNMSKGQKKQLQDCLEAMEKEDCALWSTVSDRPRRLRRMMPKGCKTFMMEIFAGAATLSYVAAQYGLPVSPPVDILYGQHHDLLNPEVRKTISQNIQEDDPYLLVLAPVCGPWSNWQNLNMSKSEETWEKVNEERKKWYPVVNWVAGTIRERLQKGRQVLMENPWGSMLWRLRSIEKLIEDGVVNQATGEVLEVVRADQCMYGLIGGT